jgi:hypothetical protein
MKQGIRKKILEKKNKEISKKGEALLENLPEGRANNQ